MRELSDDALAALAGSRAGDGVVADVWYDGVLSLADVPLSAWSLGWERSRQVQCQGSLTVVDVDGSLAPWSVGDTLGVAGPVAHLKYQIAKTEVSLGWYRVTQADVSQTWRSQRLNRPADTSRSAERLRVARERAEAAESALGVAGRVWTQDTQPPAGTTYLWSGTPGASTSVRLVDGAVAATNLTPSRISPTSAEGWSAANSSATAVDAPWGGKAIRGTHTTGVPYVFAPPIPVAVQVGQIVRARATFYPDSNDPNFRATLRIRVSDGNSYKITSAQMPNRIVHRVELEWVADTPVAADRLMIALVGTIGGDNPLLMGEVVVTVDEPLPVPVFDGDTPDDRADDIWIDTSDSNAPYSWSDGWAPYSGELTTQIARYAALQAVVARREAEHYDTGLAALHGGIIEGDQVWSSSATINLNLDDLMVQVQLSDFVANESAERNGTVLSEVARLCEGLVVVEVHPDVVDGDVPESITYEGTRIGTVLDLLGSIDAEPRMTGEATMQVIPSAPGPVVWDIAPGDDGVLVDFSRSFATADLVNTVVVEGRATGDTTLIGVDRAVSGPLSVNGPHGVVTERVSNDLLNTYAKVTNEAIRRVRLSTVDRAISLPVTCLAHPGLQVGDVVRLTTPVGPLTGPVQSINLSGSERSTAPMTLVMEVPLSDAQIIGEQLRRGA